MKKRISSLVFFWIFCGGALEVHSWEQKPLQCWQCASVPGYSTNCPNDASLYELPEWNACMIWTLNNGNRVVLQNFVYSHNDCTNEKLSYWANYIKKVWKQEGTARCCFEDQCNDGAEFVDAVNVSNNLQKVEQEDLLFEELLEQDIAPKIDCDQCLLIPNAFCLAESRNDPNSVRMPFDDMIETMTEKKSVCTCSDGYLPVFDDDGILSRCHDPIMATAIIGGRCLAQEHCAGLRNSICQEDSNVKLPNGLPIQTCQCMDGYIDHRFGCEKDDEGFEPVQDELLSANKCSGSNVTECSNIEYGYCNMVKLQCECIEGFLPVYDKEEPMKLSYCKDPIVLTSSVGGYCLIPRHCSALIGSTCMDKNPGEGGTFKRCECEIGLKPALPDPNLGIIKRCIGPNEEGVLSLISQALFGDDTTSDRLPDKVNFKLNEKALLDTCSRIMTVVELDEWIPYEQFEMKQDEITDTYLGVVQVKLPNSALGHHGVLIRLMSKNDDTKGDTMYSISLRRNRVISIRKSFIEVLKGPEEGTENIQKEEVSTSYKWINSETYTGIWFMIKYGFIAIGIVDEHSVDNPLFQWRDDKKPYDVSIAGLTSEGSAVYYGVDCPILSPREFYPRGYCKSDLDCSDVPNTDCSREPEPEAFPTTTIRLMTCRCADGYEPIPAPLRMLKNGCFDPIQKTQTVNARCNTDRHCQFLENTECIPSYQDIGIKTCRCKKGTLPKPAIKDTGLVPGCEETEFTQLLTVDSCRRIFTLGAYTQWIPITTMSMPYREEKNLYSMAFYVKFNGAANPVNTTIAIKLLDSEKSPDKFYKVTMDTTGVVAIYENVQGQAFLFGTYNRTIIRNSDLVIDPSEFSPIMFQGFWIRYEPISRSQGTISLGKLGKDRSLLQWTDTEPTDT